MQQINLYQPPTASSRRPLSARSLLEITLLAGLVLAATGGYLHWQAGRMQETLNLLLGQENALRDRLAAASRPADPERTARLDRTIADLEARLESLQAVQARLADWVRGHRLRTAELFETLSGTRLDGLWLSRVELDAEEGLRLSGAAWEAALVPEYLERLVQSGLPEGERLQRVEIERPEQAGQPVRFLLGPEQEHG